MHPDGTLELAGRLSLPPGHVRITAESLDAAPRPTGDINALFEEIDRILAAGGYQGRTVEELNADEEYEARWREIYRQTSGSDLTQTGR